MSVPSRIGRPYMASSGTPATYPVNASARALGMDHTRMVASPTGEGIRARAIDAGGRRQPPARIEDQVCEIQGVDRQRSEMSVIASATTPGQERERANARGQSGIARATMTASASTIVNGKPMTPAPAKEKARCANTGPLLDKSLVVTVGIRSDRRQTA